jgi:2-keto-4-pentenoate hydratase/2-oxohepta-3-ene-1,7-dioic acid hydratase in catechol pathway
VKVAVVNSRTSLVVGDRLIDAERASGGAVPADPAGMFAAWPALLAAAAHVELEGPPRDAPLLDHGALQRPVPVPLQAFGIGLNYADHAGESAMALPDNPLVFPKFSSSIAGPNASVATPRSDASNTCHLIFDVPTLVEYLSHRVRLHAGDLIFTGTPAGVGMGRDPREVLRPGSRIDTTISGIGTLTTRVVGR